MCFGEINIPAFPFLSSAASLCEASLLPEQVINSFLAVYVDSHVCTSAVTPAALAKPLKHQCHIKYSAKICCHGLGMFSIGFCVCMCVIIDE